MQAPAAWIRASMSLNSPGWRRRAAAVWRRRGWRGRGAALECQLDQIVDLKSDDPTRRNSLVIGTVRSVFIADDAIVDGRFDVASVRPLARLGYRDYALIDETFELQRPD